MQNNTGGDGAVTKLYYGTGSAPTNGAAVTSTQAGKTRPTDSFPTGAKRFPFGITTVISGLTLNTAYWFDLSLAIITDDSATSTTVFMSIQVGNVPLKQYCPNALEEKKSGFFYRA